MTQATPSNNPTGPLGIIAAIEDELMPTVERLRLRKEGRWWRGKVGMQDLAAGLSGVGSERAVATLREMSKELSIRSLYNIGFVGALTDAYSAGDVIVFGSVVQLGVEPVQRLALFTENFSRNTAEGPALLSSDHLVHDPAHKRSLAVSTGAVAVDMESFALAKAAEIPLCILRAVSDPVTMSLPEALPQWVKPDGRRNALRAASYLALRPWKVPTVIRLAGNSSRAARAIAEHLERVLAR